MILLLKLTSIYADKTKNLKIFMENNQIKNSHPVEKTTRPDLQKITEILSIFTKGIKTSMIYPSQNPIPREFKRSGWEKLDAYLREHGFLELDIYNDSFRDRQHVIFKGTTKEENIAGLMHRDGIRYIKFHEGLQKIEWDNFFDDILTVLRDDDKYEDLVNLFWQRDFVNIEYESVDEFALSEIEGNYTVSDNTKVEYSEILNIETQDNTVSVLESFNPGNQENKQPVAVEDNEYIDKVFQNIQKFSQAERDEIEAHVARDEELIIEFEALELLFDVLRSEEDIRSFDESLSVLNAVYDKMLAAEQFPLLVHLLHDFKEIHKYFKENSATRTEKIKDCINRCGDKIRISKITNLLNTEEEMDLEGVRLYLEELDWENLPSLIWMLGELEFFPARKMVIQAIVNKGSQRIDLVGNAIFDSRWYVVRNAALILGEIGGKRALSHLKKALEHFDERVRWEVVVAVEKIGLEEGFNMLLPLLSDESDRVRRKVIQVIGHNRISAAFDNLKQLIFSKNFNTLPGEEQKEYICALALSGGETAVGPLEKLALKRHLLFADKYEVQNEAAVTALGLLDLTVVQDVLEKVARKKKGSVGVLAKLQLEKKHKSIHSGNEGQE